MTMVLCRLELSSPGIIEIVIASILPFYYFKIRARTKALLRCIGVLLFDEDTAFVEGHVV
ncbi:hypothetical protein A2U01_0110872 [Trifolium medium]|uniref:Uncharacterized protein n=1 Tax=Trifolium medium TaxID=97028 RepID=A0A392VQ14_9FABA|nr:hypothetical protein [Trifolium medium]